MKQLIAILRSLIFPIEFGKFTVHIENRKATRYEMTESVKL